MNFRYYVVYKENLVYESPVYEYDECIDTLNNLINCVYDLNALLGSDVYDTSCFVYSIKEVSDEIRNVCDL